MKRNIASLVAATAIAWATVGPAGAADVEWKLGSPVGPQDLATKYLEDYASRVQERSNGRMAVEVIPIGPGGRGQLPTRGSHGSGRAPFGHPAPQIMVSLLNGTHCARRAQGGGDRC